MGESDDQIGTEQAQLLKGSKINGLKDATVGSDTPAALAPQRASPASDLSRQSEDTQFSQQDDEGADEATDCEDEGPEPAQAEEKRLRKEREAADAEEEARAIKALREKMKDEGFEQSAMEKLNKMLNTAMQYSEFITSQMTTYQAQLADSNEKNQEEAAKAEDDEKKGRKRRALTATASKAKKRKTVAGSSSGIAATQALVPLIKGDMRTYQLMGVKWLISAYNNGLNGILADQMGLGKTVQTIAFLSHLRCQSIFGPFLVMGPLSTLSNWVDEFKRWCPSQPVQLYHGSKSERAELRKAWKGSGKGGRDLSTFPAIVTSYEIFMADVSPLQKIHFKYLIIDEGHRLKNHNCKLIRELRTITTSQKLLLTGTPLQNNLGELWSLLNFLMPEVFKNLEDFQDWFDFGAIGQEGSDAAILAQEKKNQVVTKLHNILKPFMLRRVKSEVESCLPGKMEIVLYAPMTPLQQELNQKLLDKTLHEQLCNEKNGSSTGVGRLQNMLMQMRKVANHPDLLTSAYEKDLIEYPPAEQLLEQCGKMALLDRLLTRLHAGGHRVLIFSQMTKMLDLLHSYLLEKGHSVGRIDGSIKWQDRQADVRAFNAPDSPMFVFLLSTRAGGLGINLTAADTCIIYDSDWNPQQDLQAMDRCHRIGQTRPVLVLRMATAGSIEGRMLARAGSKLKLEKLVIRKGSVLDSGKGKGGDEGKSASEDSSASAGLTAEELMEMLSSKDHTKALCQSAAIDDNMMTQLLDRSHLEAGKSHPYPEAGPGYQVVTQQEGTGFLKSLH